MGNDPGFWGPSPCPALKRMADLESAQRDESNDIRVIGQLSMLGCSALYIRGYIASKLILVLNAGACMQCLVQQERAPCVNAMLNHPTVQGIDARSSKGSWFSVHEGMPEQKGGSQQMHFALNAWDVRVCL